MASGEVVSSANVNAEAKVCVASHRVQRRAHREDANVVCEAWIVVAALAKTGARKQQDAKAAQQFGNSLHGGQVKAQRSGTGIRFEERLVGDRETLYCHFC